MYRYAHVKKRTTKPKIRKSPKPPARKRAKRLTKRASRAPLGPAYRLEADGSEREIPRSTMSAEHKKGEAVMAEILALLTDSKPVPQELLDELPAHGHFHLEVTMPREDGSEVLGTITFEKGRVMFHPLHDTKDSDTKTKH
jgi:hypothetical protein